MAAAFQKERFATKRELNTLSQITAEAAKIFPPDYASVFPAVVEKKVLKMFHTQPLLIMY